MSMWWLFEGFALYWVTAAIGLLILLYKYLTWNYGFWESRGVPTPKSKPVPLYGHAKFSFIFPQDFATYELRLYKEFLGQKFGGYLEFRSPAMLIRDPELIRRMLVKDYEYFADRRTIKVKEPYLNKMLSTMNGLPWKHLRSTMTPTFSSGKMRNMSSLIDECGQEMANVLDRYAVSGEKVELKELCGRYALDVIATCAFGIQANSLKHPDAIFSEMVQLFTRGRHLAVIFLIFLFPSLMRLLRVGFFPVRSVNFFADAVKSAIKYREDTGTRRNDFLQLMMDARTEKLGADSEEKDQFEKDATLFHTVDAKKVLTDDDVIANSMLFFLAGYETTSSTMAFVSYLLALNPECQDQLLGEVDRVCAENQSLCLYDLVQKMEYLDMVVMETLRIYPAAVRLERVCTQDYVIPGTMVTVPKDTLVTIPLYPLHHDKEYWPDPEKFDPERFSPENKAQRSPYIFLTFGHGPKNCIGMRFALMEVKIGLVNILKHYQFLTCEKTQIPLKFNKKSNLLKPEDGIWLKLEKRH